MVKWDKVRSFGSIWWNSLWYGYIRFCQIIYQCWDILEFFFGVHGVWSFQVHMFNFTDTNIFRFGRILGILGPFACSVFLFCHPVGIALKNERTSTSVYVCVCVSLYSVYVCVCLTPSDRICLSVSCEQNGPFYLSRDYNATHCNTLQYNLTHCNTL